MKAIVCRHYGDPGALRLEDVEKPTAGEGQVLIQVRAVALNALDWHFLKGRPPIMRVFLGLRRPRLSCPGLDVAGRVESVGKGVSRFQPGDDVFGVSRGALAEFAVTPERCLAAKPETVPYEAAACAPIAGLTALQGLRDAGRVQPGQRVLINGASGGVGTVAVQVARWLGAHVTAVCGTRNVELVRSIGANRVVDYTRDDFTRSGERYDLIYDLVANHAFSAYRRVLAPGGALVPAGLGGADGREGLRRLARMLIVGTLAARFSRQRMILYQTKQKPDDLATLAGLLETRKLTPVIDSRHRLSEASAAMRRLATGHAGGKIVVTVGPDP